MRGYRRLLSISYMGHKTNEEIPRKIQADTDEYDELIALAKKGEQSCF